MLSFDEGKLTGLLTGIEPWRRLVFMAFCCERMLPNYKKFLNESQFGDFSILRRALNAAWEAISSGTRPNDLAELISECDAQAPDTEKFTSLYTSAALDAANGIAILLEALPNAEVDRAVEVARLARDTVDLYVQAHEHLTFGERNFEERIRTSPLMQQELAHQYRSLERLASIRGEREAIVNVLRNEWRDLSAGSLG